MKEKQGWITLSRKLLDNPIFKKPDYLAVWIYLLLTANHEETTFIWNSKKEILKKGQLLTGRKEISQITGVAESQVYKILNYFESEKQIEQQKTTKFTVVTVVNWNKYQQKEQQRNNKKQAILDKPLKNRTTSTTQITLLERGDFERKEQQSNNRVTTEEQQSNTYNNDNNGNNIPKGIGVTPEAFGNISINKLQTALKEKYPIPLAGVTDRRKLYNLIQVLSKRKNTDEWMDDDWRINLANFMNLYFESTKEEYYCRSLDSLKEKIKLWREYRGKLN